MQIYLHISSQWEDESNESGTMWSIETLKSVNMITRDEFKYHDKNYIQIDFEPSFSDTLNKYYIYVEPQYNPDDYFGTEIIKIEVAPSSRSGYDVMYFHPLIHSKYIYRVKHNCFKIHRTSDPFLNIPSLVTVEHVNYDEMENIKMTYIGWDNSSFSTNISNHDLCLELLSFDEYNEDQHTRLKQLINKYRIEDKHKPNVHDDHLYNQRIAALLKTFDKKDESKIIEVKKTEDTKKRLKYDYLKYKSNIRIHLDKVLLQLDNDETMSYKMKTTILKKIYNDLLLE